MASSSRTPTLPFRVLLITDRRLCRDLPGTIASALEAAPPGVAAVMLREKDLDAGPLLELALTLRRITERRGALLLVNDRFDVARVAGADGVHLPAAGLPPDRVRHAWPDALIGVSTHHAHEVRRASQAGASYATFGPVFDTPSKRPFGPPKGTEALAAACGPLPLVALGGIDAATATRARAAGASAVACIRAILSAPDPARALTALLAAFA